MRKLRVAMVVNNFDVGGLEKVVLSLLEHLDRDAFEPYVVCLEGGGKLWRDVAVPPERALVLQKQARVRLPGLQVDDAAIRAIRGFVREHRIDVVHTHNLAPLVYAGLATRLMPDRPQVVYTEHNQIYRASRLGRAKFLAYIRLADVVATCSKDLQQFFRERLHMRRDVRVLYNGIDGRRYAAVDSARVDEELGLRPDDFVVGTGVVLSEQKGITYLVAAAKEVRARAPDVKFVVAGEGPLRPALEGEARAAGLGDAMRFLGYRRDIPELISAFDLYVLPSLWEGLPLALLEALAIGKPIVATRVGGNPEIVEDGANGYIVPPRDPAALARAILAVHGDPDFRERARRRNVEKFSQLFSLEAMIATHSALYREITATRRAGE